MANLKTLFVLALVTLCYIISQVTGFNDDLYENQGFNNFGQQNQRIFNPFNDDLYENQGFNPFLQNQGQFNPFLQNQGQFNPFLNQFNTLGNPFGNLNNPIGNNPFGSIFNLFDKRR